MMATHGFSAKGSHGDAAQVTQGSWAQMPSYRLVAASDSQTNGVHIGAALLHVAAQQPL